MKLFDTWLSSIENSKDKKLWLLEENGDTKLFKLQTWFWANQREKYAESPTYHVWVGDKWACASLDYLEALETFKKQAK